MILYQYQCQQCNQIFDQYFNMSDCPATVQCLMCQGIACKIISIPGPNLASESPDWIKSIREVVDKDGGRHCQEFLKDPTRVNYKKWMCGEGVRHLEVGEKPGRPEQKSITTEMLMKHRQKKRALCLHR